MHSRFLTLPFVLSMLLSVSFLFSVNAYADKITVKKIPNDVLYMLEDMYGQDKKQWPQHIYPEDVDHDGLADWIAENKNCTSKKNCQADIFICIPDGEGKCSEYCYKEVKSLINLDTRLKEISCESSC